MKLVCLDLEGVLVPEIWINFALDTGIEELKKTTRDEPDYDKLMNYRLDILDRNGLKLPDIQRVIGGMDPLPGAIEFIDELRAKNPGCHSFGYIRAVRETADEKAVMAHPLL